MTRNEIADEIEWLAGTSDADSQYTDAAVKMIAERDDENKALRIALHDAIRRPMGVVPASADKFYSVDEAARAEDRRRHHDTV